MSNTTALLRCACEVKTSWCANGLDQPGVEGACRSYATAESALPITGILLFLAFLVALMWKCCRVACGICGDSRPNQLNFSCRRSKGENGDLPTPLPSYDSNDVTLYRAALGALCLTGVALAVPVFLKNAEVNSSVSETLGLVDTEVNTTSMNISAVVAAERDCPYGSNHVREPFLEAERRVDDLAENLANAQDEVMSVEEGSGASRYTVTNIAAALYLFTSLLLGVMAATRCAAVPLTAPLFLLLTFNAIAVLCAAAVYGITGSVAVDNCDQWGFYHSFVLSTARDNLGCIDPNEAPPGMEAIHENNFRAFIAAYQGVKESAVSSICDDLCEKRTMAGYPSNFRCSDVCNPTNLTAIAEDLASASLQTWMDNALSTIRADYSPYVTVLECATSRSNRCSPAQSSRAHNAVSDWQKSLPFFQVMDDVGISVASCESHSAFLDSLHEPLCTAFGMNVRDMGILFVLMMAHLVASCIAVTLAGKRFHCKDIETVSSTSPQLDAPGALGVELLSLNSPHPYEEPNAVSISAMSPEYSRDGPAHGDDMSLNYSASAMPGSLAGVVPTHNAVAGDPMSTLSPRVPDQYRLPRALQPRAAGPGVGEDGVDVSDALSDSDVSGGGAGKAANQDGGVAEEEAVTLL